MTDILEIYTGKREALLKSIRKNSKNVTEADIKKLTNYDLAIQMLKSARKYPLWAKFKSLGLMDLSKETFETLKNGDRESKAYAAAKRKVRGTAIYNGIVQATKTCAVAAIFPPVTVPLTGVYLAKKICEPMYFSIRNLKKYSPECKGSWIKAIAREMFPAVKASATANAIGKTTFAEKTKNISPHPAVNAIEELAKARNQISENKKTENKQTGCETQQLQSTLSPQKRMETLSREIFSQKQHKDY